MYRKNRLKKSAHIYYLYPLIFRDVWARSFRTKKMHIADSINGVKLIFLMKEKPSLFNRFDTGFLGSSLIDILLIHQNWSSLEKIQKQLFELTKNGYINRSTLASVIDRNALGDSYVFKLDSTKTKIIGTKYQGLLFCNNLKGYSNIAYRYGRLYDAINKKIFIAPINPLLSRNEVNELRYMLFFNSIEDMLKIQYYYLPSPDEYCDQLNILR
jgi:hypothetical protein